jgi:hypothetical protein
LYIGVKDRSRQLLKFRISKDSIDYDLLNTIRSHVACWCPPNSVDSK